MHALKPAFAHHIHSRQISLVATNPSRSATIMTANREASAVPATSPITRTLKAVPVTPDNFKAFGQLVGVGEDGKVFDGEDAQLQGFADGTPRFYIMRLPARGLKFHRITYHAKVTQCLGVLSPVAHWYMAVARPSGSVTNYPKEEEISVFKIPHGCYVKMEKGTWHAGPLFEGHPHMDFYNLELADTNVTDHNTHDYRRAQNLEYQVVDA